MTNTYRPDRRAGFEDRNGNTVRVGDAAIYFNGDPCVVKDVTQDGDATVCWAAGAKTGVPGTRDTVKWNNLARFVSKRLVMRDWIECSITLRRGLTGAKPESVCHWAFEMVAARPDDELDDMFPGTGAVTEAWRTWKGKFALPENAILSALEPIHETL